jgi:hypothetical protein
MVALPRLCERTPWLLPDPPLLSKVLPLPNASAIPPKSQFIMVHGLYLLVRHTLLSTLNTTPTLMNLDSVGPRHHSSKIGLSHSSSPL